MAQVEWPDLSDPEPIRELARSFWYSAILRAGLKLGVFELLEGEKLSSEELSRRIGASPRHTEALADACVVLGLLERDGRLYGNTTIASRFLVAGKERYVGDHALHHTNTWASWGRLDEVVREGRTLLPYETGYVDAPTYWTNYMMGQHNRATSGQAQRLVESVDLRGRRRLLDLGGGAASYSMALCAANPELTAVVVDRKEPLSIARPLVEEAGLRDRIELLEGDFFETDLGADYDVALISGVIVVKPDEDCRRLFALAYDALMPGATIIVQDFMRIDRSPRRARLDALEHLYVMVVFDSGAADREGEEVARWLGEAGFVSPRMIPLPTQLALVVAEKPA